MLNILRPFSFTLRIFQSLPVTLLIFDLVLLQLMTNDTRLIALLFYAL